MDFQKNEFYFANFLGALTVAQYEGKSLAGGDIFKVVGHTYSQRPDCPVMPVKIISGPIPKILL